MKIWLTKNSEVSVREQLTTQIKIAVACGDLTIGEKLPSTNEISRRFQIHANTVSNAYQELVEKQWLEFRKGSGYYVKEIKSEIYANQLDNIIAEFIQTTQKQGFTLTEIQNRLKRFFEISSPNHFLVVESDKDLQEILVQEISSATNFKTFGTTFEDFEMNPNQTGAIFVAMFDEKAKINSVLPANKPRIFLQTTSAADSMKGEQRPSENDLIAVASGWEKFLLMAKIMLLAVQIDSESLLIRSTKQPNWKKGLNEASFIICDSLTSTKLETNQQVKVFKLIAENSIEELKNAISQ
jgi:DNA-binding transcriptional regulator YhcF (GntR family)